MHTLTSPHLFSHTCTHTSLHIHTYLPSSHTQIAAQSLREVTDEFLEEGNPIITVAKKMSQQMFQMAEFTHGRGELRVCTFLSVCPSIYLSVSLSVCLSVCLVVNSSVMCVSPFLAILSLTSTPLLPAPYPLPLPSFYPLHPSRVSQK